MGVNNVNLSGLTRTQALSKAYEAFSNKDIDTDQYLELCSKIRENDQSLGLEVEKTDAKPDADAQAKQKEANEKANAEVQAAKDAAQQKALSNAGVKANGESYDYTLKINSPDHYVTNKSQNRYTFGLPQDGTLRYDEDGKAQASADENVSNKKAILEEVEKTIKDFESKVAKAKDGNTMDSLVNEYKDTIKNINKKYGLDLPTNIDDKSSAIGIIQNELAKLKVQTDITYNPDSSALNQIQTAETKNKDAATKLLTLQQVYTKEQVEKMNDTEKAAFKKAKDEGKATVLSDDDKNTLLQYRLVAKNVLESGKTLDPSKKAMYEALANGVNEKGEVLDVRAVQRALVQITGGDGWANFDEIQAAKDNMAVKVSKQDVRSLNREFKIENESEFLQRAKMFAGAFLPALGANLVARELSKTNVTAESSAEAVAKARAEATATATAEGCEIIKTDTITNTVTGGPQDLFVKDKSGNLIQYHIETPIKTSTTTTSDVSTNNWTTTVTKTVIAEQTTQATATAIAKATAKVPVLGQLAAPVIAGVIAACGDLKTQDILGNGDTLTALQNVNNIKEPGARAIMAKIQDMSLTGDAEKDTAIKVAVLKACAGNLTTALNTRELDAAYRSLEDVKKQLDGITQPTEPTAPTEATAPTGATAPTEPTEPTCDPEKGCAELETEDKDVKVKHRVGMGPWQYGEALGIPRKYMREFINQFRADNNMSKDGKTFSKTPLIQKDYTFSDGTVVHIGDTSDEVQKKINGYNLTQTKTKLKQHSVKEGEVRQTPKGYVPCDPNNANDVARAKKLNEELNKK